MGPIGERAGRRRREGCQVWEDPFSWVTVLVHNRRPAGIARSPNTLSARAFQQCGAFPVLRLWLVDLAALKEYKIKSKLR
jgi:hypothetical protein